MSLATLIDYGILAAGADGKLLSGWDKKQNPDVPKMFETLSSQEDAFVRWEVEMDGYLESKVWRDNTLWDSWIAYYKTTKKQKSLCYVTGEQDFTADQHPSKLLNDGDKAKLISCNDTSRVHISGPVCDIRPDGCISVETTQKAHFALRCINHQGYRKGWLLSPGQHPVRLFLSPQIIRYPF